ncbi:hypothetical protein CB1_001033035 [Camelus ferus]|nr:hypothetical protein CB1_001033035 [Camelus ferus]
MDTTGGEKVGDSFPHWSSRFPSSLNLRCGGTPPSESLLVWEEESTPGQGSFITDKSRRLSKRPLTSLQAPTSSGPELVPRCATDPETPSPPENPARDRVLTSEVFVTAVDALAEVGRCTQRGEAAQLKRKHCAASKEKPPHQRRQPHKLQSNTFPQRPPNARSGCGYTQRQQQTQENGSCSDFTSSYQAAPSPGWQHSETQGRLPASAGRGRPSSRSHGNPPPLTSMTSHTRSASGTAEWFSAY